MSCDTVINCELGELLNSVSETYNFKNVDNVVFLNTSDIFEGKVLNHDPISPIGLPGQAKKRIKKGDILFSEIRPANRRFALIDFTADKYVVSTKLMVLRMKSNKCDPRYLYKYLTSKPILNELQSIAEHRSGTFPQITFDQLKRMTLPLYPLNEQKAIANILSSLDDKIELNNRMNRALEEIAQTLFKRWFVDFEFPDENGNPYKSSGGRMADSELGMIPEGWSIKSFNDIVETYSGYSYKGDDLQDSTIGMLTIKSFDRNGGFKIDGFKTILVTNRVKEHHYVKPFDVLVAHTDITQKADIIGNPILVVSCAGYKKMIASMDLVKVTPKSVNLSNSLLYLLLKDDRFKQHALGYSSGTTVIHLSKKAIPDYKLPYPNNDIILNVACSSFNSLYELVGKNIDENIVLARIRDTLLPKLMSGEIRVPIAEE